MTGVLIFSFVAAAVTISGLYNLGTKARRLEQSDEDFFRHQLTLAKKECYRISKQFASQLAVERRKYLRKDGDGNLLYDDWLNQGVEPFFQTTICPKLIDVQRECLIQVGAYPEIIDQVACSAQDEF